MNKPVFLSTVANRSMQALTAFKSSQGFGYSKTAFWETWA